MISPAQASELKRLAGLYAGAPYLAPYSPELIDAQATLHAYIDSLVGEDEPVAWRVECRWADRSKGGDWRKYGDYGTLAAAESSQQRFASPGDIESRVVPLYAAPQPQPSPQASAEDVRRVDDVFDRIDNTRASALDRKAWQRIRADYERMGVVK